MTARRLVDEAAERIGAAIWKRAFPDREILPSDQLTKLGRKLDHIHARYTALASTTDRARIDRAVRQLQSIRRSAKTLHVFAEQVNGPSEELAAALFRRTAPEPAILPDKLFAELETFAKSQLDNYGAIEREAGGDTVTSSVSVTERLVISLAEALEKFGLGTAAIVNWNQETRAKAGDFEAFVSAFCATMGTRVPSRSTIEKALSKRSLPGASLEALFLASLRREGERTRQSQVSGENPKI